MWFFDNYIIPLAGKLEKCGIFGVSIDECLNYAIDNRREWADKGEAIVERMVRRYKESKCAEVDTAVVLHSQEEVILFNNSNSKDDTSSNKSTKASTVVEDDTLNIDMTPTLKPKSTVSRGSVATADIRPPTLTDETVDDVSIAFSTDSEEVDC
uniref:Uncharacterized protein n=1 Tax=Craspedostauros australis TaxID=1486917 RepID=A0A7R9ZQ51_9STRA